MGIRRLIGVPYVSWATYPYTKEIGVAFPEQDLTGNRAVPDLLADVYGREPTQTLEISQGSVVACRHILFIFGQDAC